MSLHNKHFYHGTTRRYVVAFGNIFNNIHILRYNKDGTENHREKVPMAYGPKEKYVYRNEQNADLTERYAIKLPRISYELKEIRYDATRKTQSANKLRNPDNSPTSKTWTYAPVPFSFDFQVNIMGKTSDECLQIVEQIIPFFTPDYTMTIDVIPELNHKLDIPVIINNIALTDNWDGSFQERRNIIWVMDFTLNGFLYPPVRDSKIILEADWNIAGYDNDDEPDKTILYSSGTETDPTPIP